MTRDKHDALFKHVFVRPEHVEGEPRAVLPPELMAELDLSTLEPQPETLIGSELTGRYCDVLFRVQRRQEEEALLYLLHEHQSDPDPLLPVRLFVYGGRILGRWLADQKNPPAPVPPVLTIVLSQGPKPWTVPTQLRDLYALPGPLRDLLGDTLPSLRVYVDDLAQREDDELLDRAATPLARLSWLLLKHGRGDPDLAERLAEWSDLLRDVSGSDEDLQAVCRYTLQVAPITPEQLMDTMDKAIGPKAREAFVTAGDQLRAEGELLGQQKLLLRLLRTKFGELPGEVEARVQAASAAQLQSWGDRILTAATLDEVLAPGE